MDELTDAVYRLRLAALEVADEVPPKRVAVERVLRLEVLRSILADHLHPGLCQDAQFLRRDVLRRRDDRDARADLGPDALVALPDLLR
jgi:hypothetical protein